GAVEGEEVGGVARSVDAQLRSEPGAGALPAGLRQLHAGRQRGELDVAAAVERQPFDLLGGNQAAGRRALQIDRRGFADDGDLIRDLAELQRDIDDGVAADGE